MKNKGNLSIQDLSHNDLVMVNGKICRFTIASDGLNEFVPIDNIYASFQATSKDVIEGIPITSEILEANGFHKPLLVDYWIWKQEDGNVHLFVSYVNGWVNANKTMLDSNMCNEMDASCRLFGKYVHDIQKAINFCKIPKNITL